MKKGINMKLLMLNHLFPPPPRIHRSTSSISLNLSHFPLQTSTAITVEKSRIDQSSTSILHLQSCSTMALARLALKNLQHRASYSASLLARNVAPTPSPEKQRWASLFLRGLASAAEEKAGAAHEVAVQEGGKKSKLSPRRRGRRGGNLWRRDGRDFAPALWDIFPSGLGNALIQATENINRLLENVAPSQLMGRAREHDDSYKLRYHMPGVGKDEVKITVEDGLLSIQGEHKDEKEHESDDEFWSSSSSYGYYNTSLLLPEDAKIDEIKAEMKDGVLNVVIPKIEKANKDVKEVKVC